MFRSTSSLAPLACFIAALAVALPRACEAAPPGEGARLAAALRGGGSIDPTFQAQVQEVVDVLVASSRAWPLAQVNGEYDPEALNVYLVSVPWSPSGPAALELGRTRGTVRALPGPRIVLADSGYLAELKAATEIYRRDREASSRDVLVRATVEGPDAAVRRAIGGDVSWRTGTSELFDGAIAFLIAHELGHIRAGARAEPDPVAALPPGLANRDRAWACAAILAPEIAVARSEEAAADAFATDLLGRIPRPSAPKPHLRFEFGTVFLMNAELGKTAATMAAISRREETRRLALALRFDPSLIEGMRARIGRMQGMVETAFPPTHPAQVERLMSAVESFSRNPRSSFHGDSDDEPRVMWALVIRKIDEMCKGLLPKPSLEPANARR